MPPRRCGHSSPPTGSRRRRPGRSDAAARGEPGRDPADSRCRGAALIRRRRGPGSANTERPSVLALQSRGAAPFLFCICGLDAYRPIADALAPDIPVYGMFLDAEHLPVHVQAVRYLTALREIAPSGPYLLAGFSFGGVLAYEMAQRLASAGEHVDKLTLIDCWLPSAVDPTGEGSRLWRWRRVIRPPSNARARERKVTRVMAAYPVRPYAGGVRLVRASQTVAQLGPALRDSAYGWGAHARTLETFDLPGDHAGILNGESARQLAAALRQDWSTAQLESM